MATLGEAGPRSAFVGREAELDVLFGALESARASAPQIVWIEGDPGIGKTAFVRRFLTAADDLSLLEASGDESETTLDYGVIAQLAARARPTGSAAALDERITASPPASPFSVGADLLGLLGSLQDEAPVAVWVDDAHWIDASSAAALLFALRRLHGDRVLVLIVSRVAGLDHLGPSWSRLLADSDLVRRVKLVGFTGAEVNQLADSLGFGSLTVAAGERLREHTDGHPLYVKALLHELPPERLNLGDGPLPAPHSFAATVLARLAAVSADAERLVAAAAAGGAHCPLALAGSVAELGDPLAALEEAQAADLLALVPARLPAEIAFPHPVMRAAVYDDLSPTRRRALHLAWAQLLPHAGSLTHRVAASQGADDDLAAELRVTAEAELAAGRLTAAVERLLWAAQIADSAEGREMALLRAVECLVVAGEIPAANRHRDAVVVCSDTARRSFTLAMLAAANGRLPEAEAALRQVIDRPDYAADEYLEGPVSATLAVICGLGSNGEEAVKWAQRALRAPGAPPTANTTARQALALGLLMTGLGADGIAQLAALSASRLEPEPFEAELLAARGNLKTWWGELAGAVEDLSAVVRWSRAGVPLRSLPNAYGGLAEVEYRVGRWDDGLVHADVAVTLGEESDRVWDLPWVHAVASYLNAARGNWTIAAEHVAAARRAAEAAPLPMSIYHAASSAAHLAWVRSEWDATLNALMPLLVWMEGKRAKGLGQRIVRVMAAEALIFTGRFDEAGELLDRLESELDTAPEAQTALDVWRLRGTLADARNLRQDAAAAFERGKAVPRADEAPLSHGLLDLAEGRWLHHNGSRRAAIAALRAARDRFLALGAQPFVARAEVELTACGVRSRAHSADNRFGLTAREEVVARLVASGKSNREVAEELYLSTKAIEYHLGNVFAKVNIRSRHELAARLALSA
jgi:DNA-binding CsgD family transcriptional regulator